MYWGSLSHSHSHSLRHPRYYFHPLSYPRPLLAAASFAIFPVSLLIINRKPYKCLPACLHRKRRVGEWNVFFPSLVWFFLFSSFISGKKPKKTIKLLLHKLLLCKQCAPVTVQQQVNFNFLSYRSFTIKSRYIRFMALLLVESAKIIAVICHFFWEGSQVDQSADRIC